MRCGESPAGRHAPPRRAKDTEKKHFEGHDADRHAWRRRRGGGGRRGDRQPLIKSGVTLNYWASRTGGEDRFREKSAPALVSDPDIAIKLAEGDRRASTTRFFQELLSSPQERDRDTERRADIRSRSSGMASRACASGHETHSDRFGRPISTIPLFDASPLEAVHRLSSGRPEPSAASRTVLCLVPAAASLRSSCVLGHARSVLGFSRSDRAALSGVRGSVGLADLP